jgi:HPt (histidine-containing phosphotransfer) domain-containing protein
MSSSSHTTGSSHFGAGQREDFGDPAAAEVLDENHIAQLKALVTDNSKSLFAELALIFRRESVTRFEKLGVAVKGKDAVAVARLSHSLIGSAASLGARQLQIALRKLECESSSADWPRIEASYEAVCRFREILLTELTRYDGGLT